MRGGRVSEDLQSRMNGSCRTRSSLTQKHRYRQTQPQTHTPPEEEECVVPHAPTTHRSHLYFSAICRTTPSPTSQLLRNLPHNTLAHESAQSSVSVCVCARTRIFSSAARARTQTQTQTHIHTYTHAQTCKERRRTRTHAHTRARAHTHTHQHRQTGTRRGTPARAPRLGRRAPGPGYT